MIKAIIFDLDNTLMDFIRMKRVAVDAAVDAMIDAGLKIPKAEMIDKIYEVYNKEGIEDQQIFNKVLADKQGQIDYRVLAAGIIGYRRAKEGSMALYPHVHSTLMELAKMGIKMAIISDAPRMAAWLRISALGVQHYFDYVVSFDDTGERKPSSRPFLKALELLNLEPEEVLMVGDWAERDVVGAKRMNIRTIFARYGDIFGTKESQANYEINDINEILSIVGKENNIF
jgi:putative hydrolase of the HAD superfamily